jgi:hypothetical protein
MKKSIMVFRAAIISLLCGFSQFAHAAWVGALLFSPMGATDHIHLVVSDEKNIDNGAVLNIWQGPAARMSVSADMAQASDFILFRSPHTAQELIAYWNEYFNGIKDVRNIFTSNCANASETMLKYALGGPLHTPVNFSRVIAFIYLPSVICPIRLPESVFKHAETTLKAKAIPYYNLAHYRQFATKAGLDVTQRDTYREFLLDLH